MEIPQLIGITGCVLTGVYTAVNFPVMVKTANGQIAGNRSVQVSVISGLLMSASLLFYAVFIPNYLFAFVQMLGFLKYIVLLIQLVMSKK